MASVRATPSRSRDIAEKVLSEGLDSTPRPSGPVVGAGVGGCAVRLDDEASARWLAGDLSQVRGVVRHDALSIYFHFSDACKPRVKPYCTSTHLSTHRGPTGPRRRIEALTRHLFCDISRTAGSCAYRLHSMPVASQGVLSCAAQLPDRLLIGRTSMSFYREIEVVLYRGISIYRNGFLNLSGLYIANLFAHFLNRSWTSAPSPRPHRCHTPKKFASRAAHARITHQR